MVIEADARVTCRDFADLAEARRYADDAASERESGIALAWVLDGRWRVVHEGAHY